MWTFEQLQCLCVFLRCALCVLCVFAILLEKLQWLGSYLDLVCLFVNDKILNDRVPVSAARVSNCCSGFMFAAKCEDKTTPRIQWNDFTENWVKLFFNTVIILWYLTESTQYFTLYTRVSKSTTVLPIRSTISCHWFFFCPQTAILTC